MDMDLVLGCRFVLSRFPVLLSFPIKIVVKNSVRSPRCRRTRDQYHCEMSWASTTLIVRYRMGCVLVAEVVGKSEFLGIWILYLDIGSFCSASQGRVWWRKDLFSSLPVDLLSISL